MSTDSAGSVGGHGPATHSGRVLGPNSDPDYVRAQTGRVAAAFLTEEPLEGFTAEARQSAATPAMGAVVTFEGVVRDHDGGRGVAALNYSAHPSAQGVMREVAEELCRVHPQTRIWVAHRTGALQIGDVAFLVVAAAAHRSAAFAAASDVVDEVKSRVPVWKEQEMSDGSTQWVGVE